MVTINLIKNIGTFYASNFGLQKSSKFLSGFLNLFYDNKILKLIKTTQTIETNSLKKTRFTQKYF
jgi:hypothetical protein